MMKKRRWMLLALVLCLSSAALLAMFLLGRATKIDREHFEALSVGMTRKEVERVLGGRARIEFPEFVIVWVPREGKLKSKDLRPDTPLPSFFPAATSAYGDEELVWVSESGLIAGRFTSDGLLQEKYFSTASGPKLSPLDRLLRPISREAKFSPPPAPNPATSPPSPQAPALP